MCSKCFCILVNLCSVLLFCRLSKPTTCVQNRNHKNNKLKTKQKWTNTDVEYWEIGEKKIQRKLIHSPCPCRIKFKREVYFFFRRKNLVRMMFWWILANLLPTVTSERFSDSLQLHISTGPSPIRHSRLNFLTSFSSNNYYFRAFVSVSPFLLLLLFIKLWLRE